MKPGILRPVATPLLLAFLVVLPAVISGCAAGAANDNSQLLFELLNRVEQLEREVRQLRGDLETYRHDQDQASKRIESQYLELERRVRLIDGSGPEPTAETDAMGSSTPTIAPPPTPLAQTGAPVNAEVGEFPSRPPGAAAPEQVTAITPSSPSTNPPSGSEQQAYDSAFGMLRDGHYQDAAAGFQDFLARYPTSGLASNAQYWLGEAYYVNRDYDESKQAFVTLGAEYPSSTKLPDALLKLGYIYEAQGDKGRAKEVLQKLTQEYPGTPAAQNAQERLKTM